MAFETINPAAPHHMSNNVSAWAGVKDLVERCIPEVDAGAMIRELKCQQEDADTDWMQRDLDRCNSNLIKFYHDRRQSQIQIGSSDPKYPRAEKFARLVFSCHVTSSIIETYFSKTKYIKNVHRASMRDSLSSATLHLQQLRQYVNDECMELVKNMGIDGKAAFRTFENNIERLREKYCEKRVAKPFFDDTLKEVRDYLGTVLDVVFSREEGCFLFHVRYDSDSDDEDYEQWEVSKYIVNV